MSVCIDLFHIQWGRYSFANMAKCCYTMDHHLTMERYPSTLFGLISFMLRISLCDGYNVGCVSYSSGLSRRNEKMHTFFFLASWIDRDWKILSQSLTYFCKSCRTLIRDTCKTKSFGAVNIKGLLFSLGRVFGINDEFLFWLNSLLRLWYRLYIAWI